MPCHKRFAALFFILCSLFLTTPAFADRSFDADAPTCDVSDQYNNPITGTYTTGQITSITTSTNDNSYGIYSLVVTANPVLPAPTCTPNSTCTCSSGTCTSTCSSGTCTSFPLAQMYNWIPDVDRSLTIDATNNIGNHSAPCSVTANISANPAWLQTTSGDVHSNAKIDARNGP